MAMLYFISNLAAETNHRISLARGTWLTYSVAGATRG